MFICILNSGEPLDVSGVQIKSGTSVIEILESKIDDFIFDVKKNENLVIVFTSKNKSKEFELPIEEALDEDSTNIE